MKKVTFDEVEETIVHKSVRRRKLITGRMNDAVQSFNDAYLEPGKSFSSHKHSDCEEIFYFLEGAGQMTIDKNTFPVRMGDYVTINKNETHSLKNNYSSSLRWIAIRILL